MAVPSSPSPAGQGPRRPRAWRARRVAAALSVVMAVALGGVMAWHDGQGSTASAQVGTTADTTTNSSSRTTAESTNRERDDEGEHEGEREGGDDWRSLIPGGSESSSSSNSTSSGSSAGTSVPAPHVNTRGS
jgi:hypothetical protein